MYGFPDQAEFQFLVGQELNTVVVSQHSSVFHFEDGAKITIEGVGRISEENVSLGPKEVGSKAISWIGLHIAKIDVVSKDMMSIFWSNGDIIYLLDSKTEYETFWFVDESKGKSIVV
jgi:hypothetical protein